MMQAVLYSDNLPALSKLPDGCARLIYIDPPFNTRRKRTRNNMRVVRDEQGDRVGFQGQRYRTERTQAVSYRDAFEDYLGFLAPRLQEARRVLAKDGSLFLHVDCREVHYCKVLLDEIFGRESFINEIIWAYDYGARTKTRWAAKHDNLLW
jgi:site-specific DNA-methyltransferase (adenine-specific)